MATTYYADNYGSQLRVASDSDDFTQYFLFTVPSAGFIINDLVYLCAIPPGSLVYEWYVDVPDIDASTSSVIALGDSGSATRFMANNNTGQAAGIVYSQKDGQLGILPKSYAAADNFILKIVTAPGTTATTGSFRGAVKFNLIGVPVLV